MQPTVDFPSERILMGPGPSTVPQRILRALAAPTLGHLDPEYLSIMDETRQLLRQVFQTENEMTLAVSGTGSAGMECCLVNLLEPGDEAIVCVQGVTLPHSSSAWYVRVMISGQVLLFDTSPKWVIVTLPQLSEAVT